MKITIHRGIDQIGGCITEIASTTTRILMDLGQNLPNGDGDVHDELATSEAIEKLTSGIDAIFYTHYHGDHLGLFDLVPDGIEQYIGSTAKQVAICKHQHLSFIPNRKVISDNEVLKLEGMKGYVAGQIFKVGDNKNLQNRDLAFKRILDDVMGQQWKKVLELYKLYAKDDSFYQVFYDTMKRMIDNLTLGQRK